MPDENTNTNEQATNQQGANETFETWLEKQDAAVKALYESHVTGLKNTIKATREERDQFSRELREAAAKAEKGSEAEKRLSELAEKAEAAERRATFAEEASKPEIGCANVKAAWLVAQADNLFDRKGNPDWAAIKVAAPELFRKPTVAGHAGSGTTDQPKGGTMNGWIRSAAGR
jgi:hypothetical protein